MSGRSSEDTSEDETYTFKIVSKTAQKQMRKRVHKYYNRDDVFKAHEIVLKKLGGEEVGMYLCLVTLLLKDIRNYVRKPIPDDECRHLNLDYIHGTINNYKRVVSSGIMFCVECGLETDEALDLDEELYKLIIKYFRISNYCTKDLGLRFRDEIEKVKVLPTLDNLLLVDLKNAARNLGITGVSTLRKADLKAVVFKYCTN